jgi:amidohydrolase
MLTTQELKHKAIEFINKRKEEFIRFAQDVYKNPETGFFEYRTSEKVAKKFQELGVPFRQGLAITGVKGRLQCGGSTGPSVAVIGELDGLPVPDHPYADPKTGAAHACGHAAQLGMMLGTVMGLMDSGAVGQLSGTIIPLAVPAEEFVEIEKRLALREQGKIQFLDGKQELLRLGEFDDVDMAIMCHTSSGLGPHLFGLGGTSNGNVLKYVEFIGRAAHAGGSPHLGINALNAACIALMSIHANRETFKEEEVVRIHGIIRKGGDVVSSVPADIRLEWRVRGATPDSVVKYSDMVDRCFKAGAFAVGARVKVTTIAGSLPLRNDSNLLEVFRQNADRVLGENKVVLYPASQNSGGSTDMGDVSHVKPVCHPHTAGAQGAGHSKDYLITDWEAAVVNPAKVMACTVFDLLSDGAAKAKEVLAKAKPPMTKEQYIRFQQERMQAIDFDGAKSVK